MFEVTSQNRAPEFFRNILDAQQYACEQSEIDGGKCFVYDLDWNEEVAVRLYKNGREVR